MDRRDVLALLAPPDTAVIECRQRIATVACEVFSVLNNAILLADDLALYPQYLALAEGALPEADFAAWLRQHIGLEPGNEVHEQPARYRALKTQQACRALAWPVFRLDILDEY